MPLNRNIITEKDVENLRAATAPSEVPKTLDTAPPAGAPGVGAAPESDDSPGPTEDDYLTKLLKYVPPEVIGAYIFLVGIITSNADKGTLHWWLAALLVVMLVVTVVYDIRVLNIVRPAQIVMSVIGLAVYAFALGGWFATMAWYQPWYGSIALVVFGLLVAVVRLNPLPTPNT